MGVARLPMWRACGPLAGGTPALPGGGPVSDVPGSAGLWPATGRRPAKRRQKRHARAGHTPARGAQCRRGRPWVPCRGRALEKPASVGVARLAMWRACGPLAGGTPALPGCGPVSDVPGSAGILPAPGRRPAKCRQERHARAGYSPARGAQCRRGRSWVPCRGRALEKPASVGVARLAMWRACGPLAGGTPALPGCGPVSDVPGSAGILPATGRRPAKRRQERDARAGHSPARRRPMPSRSALGALPRTGAGGARERGRRPLGDVAGLWPACGRDARAPRGWPWKRCSWERGHLARNGPKARKVPTGATRPSRLLPRPRRPMPSRSALGALPEDGRWSSPHRGVARLADVAGLPEPATAPSRTPALPGGGPVSDVPAARNGPKARKEVRSACERCSWERGHLARIGPKARKAPTGATRPSRPAARLPRRPPSRPALGAMFLGARASCPHRAEGPQSADRSDTPEPATPRPRRPCRRGRSWVPC